MEPGHLEAPQDFSNEVISGFNIPGTFDVNILCIMPTRVDSLYRYDGDNSRLIRHSHSTLPIQIKFWHGYGEWPHHFIGDFSEPPVEVAPGSWTNGRDFFITSWTKKTGKGSFFKLYNDYFGNLEIDYPSYAFSNGYYIRNIEPGNLMTDIENALKNQDITSEMRKKLTDLQNTIDDNDNNYVMIAKLKKIASHEQTTLLILLPALQLTTGCRGCFSVGDTVFFVEIRDLFCFKQAEKVPKIPVYRLFTPGCERS